MYWNIAMLLINKIILKVLSLFKTLGFPEMKRLQPLVLGYIKRTIRRQFRFLPFCAHWLHLNNWQNWSMGQRWQFRRSRDIPWTPTGRERRTQHLDRGQKPKIWPSWPPPSENLNTSMSVRTFNEAFRDNDLTGKTRAKLDTDLSSYARFLHQSCVTPYDED